MLPSESLEESLSNEVGLFSWHLRLLLICTVGWYDLQGKKNVYIYICTQFFPLGFLFPNIIRLYSFDIGSVDNLGSRQHGSEHGQPCPGWRRPSYG